MLITAEIEKTLNKSLAGIFEDTTPENNLFKAKSKLKDTINLIVIATDPVVTAAAFVLLSFFG